MKKLLKSLVHSTCGESMVVAVILMLIFMLLGLAVLTASVSTLSAQNKREIDAQAHYFATSALDAMDDSLCNGELGERLSKEVLTALTSSGNTSASLERELSTTVSLNSSSVTAEFKDARITFKAAASALEGSGASITKALINFKDVTLSVTAVSGEKDYTLTASYQIQVWATLNNGAWSFERECRLKNVE